MALLIPDEKCLVLHHKIFYLSGKNAAGNLPGPVAPSAADPAPFLPLCIRSEQPIGSHQTQVATLLAHFYRIEG